jgi:hypothetical protein
MSIKVNSCRYQVVDTFNNALISNHRTLEAAVRAEIRFRRAIRKANNNSFGVTNVFFNGRRLEGRQFEYYLSLLAN